MKHTGPTRTSDLYIGAYHPLISPRELKRQLPMDKATRRTVVDCRRTIEAILTGGDPRLLVVVGPCSIHDPDTAMEYAGRLHRLQASLADVAFMAMRVYFEKPRTKLGWRGLIFDPHLDGSYDIRTGLQRARRLLLNINGLGLAAATELLDPIIPQYIDDLLSWSAIGARTTESQTHREMASGLSMPVGFKNGTDGNIEVAINAFASSRHPHGFIGIDQEGRLCTLNTNGNPRGHIILRGGRSGPNYRPEAIRQTCKALTAASLPNRVMVDCNHGNTGKDHTLQAAVFRSLIEQRLAGEDAIIGCMIESNLHAGSQPITADLSKLRYGVSVTDPCIGWEETEALLTWAAERIRSRSNEST